MRKHKFERAAAAVLRLPAPERRTVTAALYSLRRRRISQTAALEAASDIILAHARTENRRESDRRTDTRRRVLVGARVPREAAEKYRAAAERAGVSLYRWVADALEAAADRQKEREAYPLW